MVWKFEILSSEDNLKQGARLDGTTAVVTGSNTGIGKSTASRFYGMGCKVIMACRDLKKARQAAEDVRDSWKDTPNCGRLVPAHLDLASLNSIRAFTADLLAREPGIHLLINNAGVMMCPRRETKDGFEMQFGTNHLGHFLLTMLLLPRLIRSAPSRIVNLSSAAHKVGKIDFADLHWKKTTYSPVAAYSRSKLANVLFTKELARRLKGKMVNVYAVHPGIVRTELGRHVDEVYFPGLRLIYRTCIGWCMKSPEQGARTTVYCATDENAGRETGLYYENSRVVEPGKNARDEQAARRLWEVSWKEVRLGDFDPFAAELQSN